MFVKHATKHRGGTESMEVVERQRTGGAGRDMEQLLPPVPAPPVLRAA